MKPDKVPIGLLLARTAKTVSRTFEARLSAAGGSLPEWLILLALIEGRSLSQSELADKVGVRGPTLTHHLNSMEKAGLLRRSRRPENRRMHDVTVSGDGHAHFRRLRQAAAAFDAHLRRPFDTDEIEILRDLLTRMATTADAADKS